MVRMVATCGPAPRTARAQSRYSRPEAPAATAAPASTASGNPNAAWPAVTVQPPSSSTEPCAKFITPEALKTTTKPSAISA